MVLNGEPSIEKNSVSREFIESVGSWDFYREKKSFISVEKIVDSWVSIKKKKLKTLNL